MLKRLHLKNFTVFADADFEFSPGLNVLVGTNGTGKSHVLKVGYAVESVRAEISAEITEELEQAIINAYSDEPRVPWGIRLRRILPAVFLSSLTTLVRRESVIQHAEVKTSFEKSGRENFTFIVHRQDESITINDGELTSSKKIEALPPILIPAKEILTLSWMLAVSQQVRVTIEKNYLDLLNQLRLLPLHKPESAHAVEALTELLNGELQEEGDKYFLIDKKGQRTTVGMVAEGLRKFGTLQKLLANGSLTKNNTLYWDEPEANLNPALLRKLAAILAELARQGFQIILATHSMSLLKEFHILSRQKEKGDLPIKYFGLNAEPGQPTTVVTRDDFEYLPDVVALAVELEQADELEEIFAREDREYYANNRGEE